MSRAEYSQHSRKIKNDIEIIKDTINNFKELNEYFKKKKIIINITPDMIIVMLI